MSGRSVMMKSELDGATLVSDDKVNKIRTYSREVVMPDGSVAEAQCTVYYGQDEEILRALGALDARDHLMAEDGHVSKAGVRTSIVDIDGNDLLVRKEEVIDPILEDNNQRAQDTRGQRFDLDGFNHLGNIPVTKFLTEVAPRMREGEDKVLEKYLEANPSFKSTEKRLA